MDIKKTALLDGKQSRDGTHCKAMSLARQPNIDLCLAQNAPINDLHLLLLCLYVSPSHFISPTSLLQRGSTLGYRSASLMELADKFAYNIETGVWYQTI
jgi:hypothetical protein